MPKAHAKSLYIGQEVTVRVRGELKTGEVLEIQPGKFCIQYEDGDTAWISNSAIVG